MSTETRVTIFDVLRAVEWHQQRWNGVASCPYCGGYEPTGSDDEPLEGHRSGCALAAFLRQGQDR